MENPILLIIALILGLIFGGGAAWFFASRPVADLQARLDARDADARALDEKFRKAVTELATMSERAVRADGLAVELDTARLENANFKAERAGFAEQKRLLEESRDKLLTEFENTGAKVLQRNQEEFLKRAEARFKQSEETGEAKIKTLLAPVGERLEKYERQVETLEKQRVDAFGQLNGLIQSMRGGYRGRPLASRCNHQCAGAKEAGDRFQSLAQRLSGRV